MKNKFKIKITLSLLTILFFQISSLNLGNIQVDADSIVGETLLPGQVSDTGNHTLDDSFIHDKNNWNILSGTGSGEMLLVKDSCSF